MTFIKGRRPSASSSPRMRPFSPAPFCSARLLSLCLFIGRFVCAVSLVSCACKPSKTMTDRPRTWHGLSLSDSMTSSEKEKADMPAGTDGQHACIAMPCCSDRHWRGCFLLGFLLCYSLSINMQQAVAVESSISPHLAACCAGIGRLMKAVTRSAAV